MPGRLRFDLDKLEDVVAVLTLGAGILAWSMGVDRWWLVFVIGWVVLVPLIDELTDMVDVTESAGDDAGESAEDAALDRLRERYATGEISEEEFERRVERLLETEDREVARERIRDREWEAASDLEAERAR